MYNKDIGRVKECKFGTMDLSDHSPVNMKMDTDRIKTHLNWRLNSFILKGDIKEEIKQEIKIYLEDNDNEAVPPNILWDACKAVLRGKLTAKSALLKKTRQEKLKHLEHRLIDLE